MTKYVYKGKVNSNDVVYKESCFHSPFDHPSGSMRQNIMKVVTETGKEFRFRAWVSYYSIIECLIEKKNYIPDPLNEVIIEEKGKKTLKYNIRKADPKTIDGMRTKLVFEKANQLYNSIRQEILKELKEQCSNKEKLKDKTLEKLIMHQETEDQIMEEVNDLFDMGTKIGEVCLYRDNAKKFIEFFSKTVDKSKKKELLGIIFNCAYENKEVIGWLNQNEAELLREVGFNG